MSWGDAWGSGPRRNAVELAKAFYEGRERSFGKSLVEFHRYETRLEYIYNGVVIAWYTPDSVIPRLVAEYLATGRDTSKMNWPLKFRCHFGDKGEARHLQALGVDAKWQWGGNPFLICGVEAIGEGWHSLDEWKAMPKWVEPAKPANLSRPERFINLTMPLFT